MPASGAQWAGLVLDSRVALVEAGRRVQCIIGDIDDVGDLGEFGRRGQQGLDFVLIRILDRDLGRNGRIGIRVEIALAGEIDVDDVLARIAEGVALDGGRIRRRFPGRSRAFHAVRIAHRNMLAVDEDAAPVDRVERARNVIMRGIDASGRGSGENLVIAGEIPDPVAGIVVGRGVDIVGARIGRLERHQRIEPLTACSARRHPRSRADCRSES